MLRIQCNKCGKDLDEPGSLAFSPPDKYDECKKFHICLSCWPLFQDWLSLKVETRSHDWHCKDMQKLGYKAYPCSNLRNLVYSEIFKIFPKCIQEQYILNRFETHQPFGIKFSPEEISWKRGDWSKDTYSWCSQIPMSIIDPVNYDFLLIPSVKEKIIKEVSDRIKNMECYYGLSFYRNNSTEESILFIHGIYE